ncbi:MAG TPA: TlpA disulfide reductase family protein [Bryobacteraceae bacterium]|nr:TlpA disulfide reductase family protein [Bryobacteraceae bacterium]
MKTLAAFAAFVALSASALAVGPVPRPAKDFDFVDANGKHYSLSSYKGKVVVIQFLLTTCPHCQAMSSQVLAKMQNELGPRGFQVLGVAYNANDNGQPASAVREYASKYAPNFPVGYVSADDAQNRQSVLFFLGDSVMDRMAFPQVAVIDRKGTIRAQSEPQGTAALQQESSLRQLVESLLNESATSSAKKAPAVTAATKKQ